MHRMKVRKGYSFRNQVIKMKITARHVGGGCFGV